MARLVPISGKCEWCSLEHPGVKCGLVKAIEYFADGRVKRVEFLTPGDYGPPLLQQSPFTFTLPPTEIPPGRLPNSLSPDGLMPTVAEPNSWKSSN